MLNFKVLEELEPNPKLIPIISIVVEIWSFSDVLI